MAFNAGIWGYNEWVPTLEALCRWKHAVPFVVTAYTIEEAEDDAEVMETTILSTSPSNTSTGIHDSKELLDRKRLWSAEPNPFASKQERETASAAKGRHYFENGAWLAGLDIGWRIVYLDILIHHYYVRYSLDLTRSNRKIKIKQVK
jgi:hypothetical protein